MTHQETKREAAVRLAKEAGFDTHSFNSIDPEEIVCWLSNGIITDQVERLIELAKAEQREADARICESKVTNDHHGYATVAGDKAKDCAAAIRGQEL